MALVKCRECGHKISTTAEACPNCGASQTDNTERKEHRSSRGRNESSVSKGLGLGCGIGMGLVLGIVIALILIPVLGISMCGYTASKIADTAPEIEREREAEQEQKRAEEVQKKIEQEQIKLAYMNKVKLVNVEVSKAQFGGKGVFGEIKNTGDKTLSEVEITIYYLDKTNKPVFEKIYHPVLVSEWSTSKEILKPNYAEKFGYNTDDAPSEWSGKVDVKITDIEFYEDE